MKIKVPVILLISFLFFLGTTSFNKRNVANHDFDNQVKSIILRWYNLFLNLESKDIYAFPPVSADRIAQMGLAGSLTFSDENIVFESQKDLTLLILNQIYSEVLSGFFTTNMSSLENIHQLKTNIAHRFVHSGPESEKIKLYSKNVINKVQSLIDQKSNNSCYSNTLSVNNKWYNFQFRSSHPILPDWGSRETLLLNQEDISVNDPYANKPSFNTALHQDALGIITQSINMSKEDQWIAEFWSDDVRGLTFSPAGRWVAITNQIVQKEVLSIPEMLNLYLQLGIGLNDAATLCWKYKYKYNLQRPSAFINQYIDPEWKPYHDNPDFPSYPSGHAVLGGVASTILEHYFGSNYHFTDQSHHNRLEFFGKKRSFESIKAMAMENAYSRFVMGVHYKEDCEAGLRLGFDVGNIVKKVEAPDILHHISQKQKLTSNSVSGLTIENSASLSSHLN